MQIIIGSDHGGYKLKEEILKKLSSKYELVDVGAFSEEKDDSYVEAARKVVDNLGFENRGIVLCRNGVGVSIVANRYEGVRCALGFDKKQVLKAREDDDVNCLALPADYIDLEEATKLIEVFLETKFSGKERYKKRIEEIENLNPSNCCGGNCGGC